MPIFGATASTSPGAIPVYGYCIAVSRWTAEAVDTEQAIPTFGAFAVENRLRFRECLIGSSVVGMSHGRLELALGEPISSLSVEECAAVLSRGDRVIIGSYNSDLRVTSDVTWMFAGYVTRLQMTIDGGRESVVYRLEGPEWVWGNEMGAGALKTVRGQLRRKPAAEDAWLISPGTVTTAPTGIIGVEAERTIFNPGGRGNMSAQDVEPLESAKPSRIFEVPDRLSDITPVSARWTVSQAARYLLRVYNDATKTGINNPDFDTWGIPSGLTIRQTDCDRMGLWGALVRVMAPDWGFYVDPKPTGLAWGPFVVKVFSRNTGTAANLHLDIRGTLRNEATASVTRLDLTSDIGKCVSKVRVFGRKLIHCSIRYRGSETTADDKTTLQHGWSKTAGDLTLYDADEPGKFPTGYTRRKVITPVSIESRAKKTEWAQRFNTTGSLFEKYRHVFRLFTWNEAGEWVKPGGATPDIPQYFAMAGPNTGFNLNWWIPDVGDLWGATGQGVRRRRRMVDTQYKDPAKVDTFRRVRPMLYMAYKTGTGGGDLSAWYKVPTGKYQLDEERCAIWFTAEDLSAWSPFWSEQNDDEGLPNDDRSFATLLRQGVLRLALEGCIEADTAEFYAPAKPADVGTPYYFETIARGGAEIIKITNYTGDGFIFAGDVVTVDDTPDATTIGDQLAQVGKDAQVHASILVAADWPIQPIGYTISAIAGRAISLMTGAGAITGRPAQIVAVRMDADANKWELLTESAALALKDTLRRASANQRDKQIERRRQERGAPSRPTRGELNQ